MCLSRGCSNIHVYMQGKPTKRGIKLYQLCESGSGYMVRFEVMAHKPYISNIPFDICQRLMQPFLNLDHCLFIDNYYCSPALCDSFVASNSMVISIVRQNRRELPKDLMNKTLGKGEMDFWCRNQVIAIKWKEQRDMQVLRMKHLPTSSAHTSHMATIVRPNAVIDYNINMSGVDLSDQLISYNPMHRKTVEGWKKLAFHLLTLCMVQSHILHNKILKPRKKKV